MKDYIVVVNQQLPQNIWGGSQSGFVAVRAANEKAAITKADKHLDNTFWYMAPFRYDRDKASKKVTFIAEELTPERFNALVNGALTQVNQEKTVQNWRLKQILCAVYSPIKNR